METFLKLNSEVQTCSARSLWLGGQHRLIPESPYFCLRPYFLCSSPKRQFPAKPGRQVDSPPYPSLFLRQVNSAALLRSPPLQFSSLFLLSKSLLFSLFPVKHSFQNHSAVWIRIVYTRTRSGCWLTFRQSNFLRAHKSVTSGLIFNHYALFCFLFFSFNSK